MVSDLVGELSFQRKVAFHRRDACTFSINYFIKTDMVCACVLSVGVRMCLSVFVMQKVKFHSIKKGGGETECGF